MMPSWEAWRLIRQSHSWHALNFFFIERPKKLLFAIVACNDNVDMVLPWFHFFYSLKVIWVLILELFLVGDRLVSRNSLQSVNIHWEPINIFKVSLRLGAVLNNIELRVLLFKVPLWVSESPWIELSIHGVQVDRSFLSASLLLKHADSCLIPSWLI